MTLVPGFGPSPCDVVLVGEAPGRQEAKEGRPFVGKSGQEQDSYFARCGLSARAFYKTNVVKAFIDGNPDPTVELIRQWTPVLEREITTVSPKVIVAVGRFAARWLLGDAVDMGTSHGIPHLGGAFNSKIAHRANGAVVIPVYHPAAGLRDADIRATVVWDYEQASRVIRDVRAGRPVEIRYDEYEGRERYIDAGAQDILDYVMCRDKRKLVVGIDTEGSPSDPWSVQVSVAPGEAYVLRASRPDFQRTIGYLQSLTHDSLGAQRALFVLHNGMYDVEMCRAMGLDLSRARLFDTMYAAYLLRLEPQGLKSLAYRWLGTKMTSYEETVGRAAVEAQTRYLMAVCRGAWPKPRPRPVESNAGTVKLYRPQSVQRRAEKILTDFASEAADDQVDLHARWLAVDKDLRSMVESDLGPFPRSTLANLPLDAAVRYSARDADVTRRLYYRLEPELARQGLLGLMATGMRILPVFEQMQAHGMPASRVKFADLTAELEADMERLQWRISRDYYNGDPFNPMSQKQVGALMRRRQLEGMKLTSTGKVSTAKKSIEHLRHRDPAIAAIIDWRENQKVRDTFCRPILERIPADVDFCRVRCQLKTTRVHTRRLAAASPNLLAIPARKALGKRVRDCYTCPPGYVLGAWDLSQIEARAMAHATQDPKLVQLFWDKRDIHTETAAAIFGVPVEEVNKHTQRLPAKTALFGMFYGLESEGLSDQLRVMSPTGEKDWPVHRCRWLLDKILDTYSGIRRYRAETAKAIYETGIVRDHWGMMRHVPGIWSRDEGVRAEATRIAVSHRIQGMAQGMIQNSIIWIDDYIRRFQRANLDVNWVLQIHDEVILQFPPELWDELNALVLEGLTRHHGVDGITVPIEAEGHMAESWGNLKGS